MLSKGSNQYIYRRKLGLKPEAYTSILEIIILVFLGSWFLKATEPKIISPLSNNPIIPQVYAMSPDVTTKTVKEAVMLAGLRMFGAEELYALDQIVMNESSYNNYAVNPNGGACGLYQAYPCSKMKCELSDVDCQNKWGLSYIKSRYSTPTKAWAYWLIHRSY